MDFTQYSLEQLIGVAGGFLTLLFVALKYLLDRNFFQQKELKILEAENIDKRFSSIIEKFDRDVRELNKDINNLGSNLRGFKGSMEGFQNTIAQVSLNHEKISLRIQQIELTLQTLEPKVREMIHFEILKAQKNSNA